MNILLTVKLIVTTIPLVLIPGLLCNEKVWDHQLRHLRDIAEIQVISLFHEDTPEKMVKTLLTRAPSQFALAGHSMGGWLALEVMRASPRRVLKLCLLNTSARGDSSEKLARRKRMIQEIQQGKFLEIAQQFSDLFVLKKSVKEKVLHMFLEVGEKAFIHQQNAMIQRDDCVPILPFIKVPTLVIHAREDRNFPLEVHEELASMIPNAKLAIIEDSGHMSPMECPEAVTALMRFWLNYF